MKKQKKRTPLVMAEDLRFLLRPETERCGEAESLKSNLKGCANGIVFTDKMIEEIYFWQTRKRIYWQRVKIELYVIKERCAELLNQYNQGNGN